MKTLVQLTLYSLIISSISFMYGKEVGHNKLLSHIETHLSYQTKTQYLMCVSKPSKDILIYKGKVK